VKTYKKYYKCKQIFENIQKYTIIIINTKDIHKKHKTYTKITQNKQNLHYNYKKRENTQTYI